MGKVIYLSPANHKKPYAVSGRNEKDEMEKVAKRLYQILSAYDCTVIYPSVFSSTSDYRGRPQEAKQKGADVYVAIHSNAATKMGAYATGCVGFYHRANSESKRLATAIQEELDALCPIPSNRYDSVVDGMTMFNGYGLGEIREPTNLGMVAVLIETNFHSYEPTAQWIISNINVIAQGMADAIVRFYGLTKKSASVSTGKQVYYRVQVGVFGNQVNAKNYLTKVKAHGFTGTIVVDKSSSKPLYRVQVGAFEDRQNAVLCANKLKSLGYNGIIMTVTK